MFIRKLTLENVKGFRGKHQVDFIKGVNFLVGDNNTGKSTIMEALLFVFQGPTANRWTSETFNSANADEATRVEVEITDGVDQLVQQPKFKRLENYIFEEDGQLILRLERSGTERTIVQNGSERTLDVKTVCFWNPKNQQFENVTGIDASVKSIFDFEAVWADAHPKDHIDFSATKTLGRLIDSAFKQFSETEQWVELTEAHNRVFSNGGEGSFVFETKQISDALKNLMNEQYGDASFSFQFSLPDATTFMKHGNLLVDDGVEETPVESKGNGMQRAIALGLIQLYARSSAASRDDNQVPLILILDEPETWLHPRAQLQLGKALSVIGQSDQVFIVTHSPYLIRTFDHKNHLLTILNTDGLTKTINRSNTFGLLSVGEPTWGEINYRAFGICSHEFHNELYGHIQMHLERKKGNAKVVTEKEIDEFFRQEGFLQNMSWIDDRDKNQTESLVGSRRTLPVYIRNKIHHPENLLNSPFTESELQTSTDMLVSIAEKIGITD